MKRSRRNSYEGNRYPKKENDTFSLSYILKISVLGVYFVLNLDEIVKLPVMYRHYRKYGWLKNIT